VVEVDSATRKRAPKGELAQDKVVQVDAKATAKVAKAEAAAVKKGAADAAKAEKSLRRQQSSRKWSFTQAPPPKPGLKPPAVPLAAPPPVQRPGGPKLATGYFPPQRTLTHIYECFLDLFRP
jgi:hypothetical protein